MRRGDKVRVVSRWCKCLQCCDPEGTSFQRLPHHYVEPGTIYILEGKPGYDTTIQENTWGLFEREDNLQQVPESCLEVIE